MIGLSRHKIAKWGWTIYSRVHPRDSSIEVKKALLSERLNLTLEEIDQIIKSTD